MSFLKIRLCHHLFLKYPLFSCPAVLQILTWENCCICDSGDCPLQKFIASGKFLHVSHLSYAKCAIQPHASTTGEAACKHCICAGTLIRLHPQELKCLAAATESRYPHTAHRAKLDDTVVKKQLNQVASTDFTVAVSAQLFQHNWISDLCCLSTLPILKEWIEI